jgi:ATP-dependent Clp protease ATP-binding subunit ClpB
MPFLLKKLGINKQTLDDKIEEAINSYPKVSGSQPYLSNESAAALQKATGYLKEFGDEFVAVEHIILGLLSSKDKIATVMKSAGFAEKEMKLAIKELRGGNSVTDQNAEAKYKSLERYSKNLNEMARQGQESVKQLLLKEWLKELWTVTCRKT